MCVLGCSVASDSATPWTIARQAPLSMKFSRQEYWNGLSFPTPGDLLDPGIKPESLVSPALAGHYSLPLVPPFINQLTNNKSSPSLAWKIVAALSQVWSLPLLFSYSVFSMWKTNQAPPLLCSERSSGFLASRPGSHLPRLADLTRQTFPASSFHQGTQEPLIPVPGTLVLPQITGYSLSSLRSLSDVTFSGAPGTSDRWPQIHIPITPLPASPSKHWSHPSHCWCICFLGCCRAPPLEGQLCKGKDLVHFIGCSASNTRKVRDTWWVIRKYLYVNKCINERMPCLHLANRQIALSRGIYQAFQTSKMSVFLSQPLGFNV